MDEVEYLKLCDRESSLILQKIVCPYCGYVYDTYSSINIGISNDCEDEVETKCKKCKKDIIVHSIVTEYRLWTVKAKDGE